MDETEVIFPPLCGWGLEERGTGDDSGFLFITDVNGCKLVLDV